MSGGLCDCKLLTKLVESERDQLSQEMKAMKKPGGSNQEKFDDAVGASKVSPLKPRPMPVPAPSPTPQKKSRLLHEEASSSPPSRSGSKALDRSASTTSASSQAQAATE